MQIEGITVGQLLRFLSDKDPETRIVIQHLGGTFGVPLLSTEWQWGNNRVVLYFSHAEIVPSPSGPADNVKYLGMTEDRTKYTP